MIALDELWALIRRHIPEDDFAAFYVAVDRLPVRDAEGFLASCEERGICAPDGSY